MQLAYIMPNWLDRMNGATAMGVSFYLKKKHPAAICVPCSAQSLNLPLSLSCKVQDIRNCIETIKSVANFIKISALHTETLKNKRKEYLPISRSTKHLCVKLGGWKIKTD